MWAKLLELLLKQVTKKLVKPFKANIKIAKHPIKYVKRLTKKFTTVKGFRGLIGTVTGIKKVSELTRDVEKLGDKYTPKGKLRVSIHKKARLIERLWSIADEKLRSKSSVNLTINVEVRNVNSIDKFLRGRTEAELNNIEKNLDNELKSMGIGEKEMDTFINDKTNMSKKDMYKKEYDKAIDYAYESYMDNWKTKFFSSDTTDHLEEDVKDEIWEQIENDKTFEWFAENKIDK